MGELIDSNALNDNSNSNSKIYLHIYLLENITLLATIFSRFELRRNLS